MPIWQSYLKHRAETTSDLDDSSKTLNYSTKMLRRQAFSEMLGMQDAFFALLFRSEGEQPKELFLGWLSFRRQQ